MKPYTLTNREGESISPMTSTKTVFDANGTDLETLLSEQQQAIDDGLGACAKKTEVAQGLATKQDALSDSADITVSADNELSLTEKAKYATFDAQWTAAGGTVIESGKVYECNGTDDLTFAEAIDIYAWYTKAFTADCSYRFCIYPHRAMLPVCGTNEKAITADRMFCFAKKIKVIKFRSPRGEIPPYVNMTRPIAAFMSCDALREIDTPIQFTASPDSAFRNCAALEEVRLYKLAYNLNIGSSPLLSLTSLQYLVANATNTTAITVTVHADVFAKLTDESNTEWHAVAVAALAKNITIAST